PISRDGQLTLDSIRGMKDLSGSILLGGLAPDIHALKKLGEEGIRGLICGSITSDVLRAFTQREAIASVTGDEPVPLQLMIPEGFGELPLGERFYSVASAHTGASCSMSGITQVRAGAVRPELIISHNDALQLGTTFFPRALEMGMHVRC